MVTPRPVLLFAGMLSGLNVHVGARQALVLINTAAGLLQGGVRVAQVCCRGVQEPAGPHRELRARQVVHRRERSQAGAYSFCGALCFRFALRRDGSRDEKKIFLLRRAALAVVLAAPGRAWLAASSLLRWSMCFTRVVLLRSSVSKIDKGGDLSSIRLLPLASRWILIGVH